jgi:hypothetical protein
VVDAAQHNPSPAKFPCSAGICREFLRLEGDSAENRIKSACPLRCLQQNSLRNRAGNFRRSSREFRKLSREFCKPSREFPNFRARWGISGISVASNARSRETNRPWGPTGKRLEILPPYLCLTAPFRPASLVIGIRITPDSKPLAEQYGVSRDTARKAAESRRVGFVDRQIATNDKATRSKHPPFCLCGRDSAEPIRRAKVATDFGLSPANAFSRRHDRRRYLDGENGHGSIITAARERACNLARFEFQADPDCGLQAAGPRDLPTRSLNQTRPDPKTARAAPIQSVTPPLRQFLAKMRTAASRRPALTALARGAPAHLQAGTKQRPPGANKGTE